MWLILIVAAAVCVLILRAVAKSRTGGSGGRSGVDALVLLLNSMSEGEEGGRNLAEIFNNMEGEGAAKNFAGYVCGMPEAKVTLLAKWIETASYPELVAAAKYISRANVYQLVNLQDHLQELRAARGTSRTQRPTKLSESRA
jgi:hypothetical protein